MATTFSNWYKYMMNTNICIRWYSNILWSILKSLSQSGFWCDNKNIKAVIGSNYDAGENFYVCWTFCREYDDCKNQKRSGGYKIFYQIFVYLMVVNRKLRRQINVLIIWENCFDPIHLWNSAQLITIRMINYFES